MKAKKMTKKQESAAFRRLRKWQSDVKKKLADPENWALRALIWHSNRWSS